VEPGRSAAHQHFYGLWLSPCRALRVEPGRSAVFAGGSGRFEPSDRADSARITRLWPAVPISFRWISAPVMTGIAGSGGCARFQPVRRFNSITIESGRGDRVSLP